MRDFCKPEFSRPYFFDRADNDYGSPLESRREKSELDIYSSSSQNMTQAFANGFVQGAAHPLKTGLENSGIGLFINFVASTEQSDFSQHNTISHQPGIVHFCDKAGELCGAWAVMYTGIRTAAWVIEAGLAKAGYYAISQRGVQYVFDNVMQVERPVAVTDEFASSTSTRQFMGKS